MTNLSSAARPSCLALAASSRASMHKPLCLTSAKNSTSLLRIASVFIVYRAQKTANGLNGNLRTGNSLSTTSEQDLSNLTGVCFWNSIGERMAPHFLHQNCGRFSNRKARGSCVGKRCLRQILRNALASNKSKICRSRPFACHAGNPGGCPTIAGAEHSQFPVRPLPPHHLLHLPTA